MSQQNVNITADSPAKLTDSVYVMEQSFDGTTVRGTLVVGTRRAVIFDTLIFPQETKRFLSLCLDRELIVVYSHADWDHVWGTSGLSPSEIIGHAECAKRFEDRDDVQKTFDDCRDEHESVLSHIELLPPQRTFQSSLTLDLGGISMELHHCPGHTKDSVVAIVPERALLLGADCIEKPLPLLNEGPENLSQWIQALSELEHDTRITTCVPSHGEIGGRELLTSNIAYLRSLLSNDPPSLAVLDHFYAEGHRKNRSKTASLRNRS